MKTTKKNTLIFAILLFTTFLFLIGTIFFFKSDYENKRLNDALLSEGIKAKGYVLSKSYKKDRQLSSSDLRIEQYLGTHFITFWYEHSIQAVTEDYSLDKYLTTTDTTKNKPTVQSLGRVEAQAIVEEERYNALSLGASIDVIYLANEPLSVQLLNKRGEINLPNLSFFSYTALLLTLLSTGLLFYYSKTGRTF